MGLVVDLIIQLENESSWMTVITAFSGIIVSAIGTFFAWKILQHTQLNKAKLNFKYIDLPRTLSWKTVAMHSCVPSDIVFEASFSFGNSGASGCILKNVKGTLSTLSEEGRNLWETVEISSSDFSKIRYKQHVSQPPSPLPYLVKPGDLEIVFFIKNCLPEEETISQKFTDMQDSEKAFEYANRLSRLEYLRLDIEWSYDRPYGYIKKNLYSKRRKFSQFEEKIDKGSFDIPLNHFKEHIEEWWRDQQKEQEEEKKLLKGSLKDAQSKQDIEKADSKIADLQRLLDTMKNQTQSVPGKKNIPKRSKLQKLIKYIIQRRNG
jgi:hypothetical protein